VGPRPWPIEYEAPVRINSLGLRGPEVEEREPGELRILFLGDSVVAGFEVPYEQTLTAVLEDQLGRRLERPVRVINAAVRGYGTDQSYLYFRERGHRLGPDLVIMVHAYNDAWNNMTMHRMRRLFGKPAFALADDGSLELKGYPTPEYPLCSSWVLDPKFRRIRTDDARMRVLCALQMNVSDHSALFSFLTLRFRRNPELLRRIYSLASPPKTKRPDRSGAAYRLTSRLLRGLAEDVRSSGARFLLVVPERQMELLDLEAIRAEDGHVAAIAEKLAEGVEVRDTQWENDGHWNRKGHRLAAEFLERVVMEKGLDESPDVRRSG
jgi:hypothetical protein